MEELDLFENAASKDKCMMLLLEDMREYAHDFCMEFGLWSSAPNRKKHIPYVAKILCMPDEKTAGCDANLEATKMLLRQDGWECYKTTDHYFYRKKLPNCDILSTKISMGSGEIHRELWQRIRTRQLKVTQEYFNNKI